MNVSNAAFTGSVPDIYDRCLRNMLFEPYAADMATRVAALRPDRLLETAAGTGIVTRHLAATLPRSTIVASDLNDAMLATARKHIDHGHILWQQADATALPFEEHQFDAVVCQFGVMFFPDRIQAFREARRVLDTRGTFIFNVWDDLKRNELARVVANALDETFPAHPPHFMRRGPFGCHDIERLRGELRVAGFESVDAQRVEKRSRASAVDAAFGLCAGSPLAAELEALHGADALALAVEAVTAKLRGHFGTDEVDAPMSATVIAAR